MESSPDRRRKLTDLDYVRISYYNSNGTTIRNLAAQFNISTKYVGRILRSGNELLQTEGITQHKCSSCGYGFDHSGLMVHQEVWTSGGNSLACGVIAPR